MTTNPVTNDLTTVNTTAVNTATAVATSIAMVPSPVHDRSRWVADTFCDRGTAA